MSENVTLYWHPSFGAVLAIEADSDVDISEVLDHCSFTSGLTARDVRFVKRRWFWQKRNASVRFVPRKKTVLIIEQKISGRFRAPVFPMTWCSG